MINPDGEIVLHHRQHNVALRSVETSTYLNAFVIANASGNRYYGRFLPSVYCGKSGCSTLSGQCVETLRASEELVLFRRD